MLNKFITLMILLSLTSLLSACDTMEKLSEPLPLEGKDVSVHSLGTGEVDLRLRVSGLSSTLWVTTELVNHSTQIIQFETPKLLQLQDTSCLDKQDFEPPRTESIAPNQRQVVRYSFRLHAAQKDSPDYERCKAQALRFTVSGVQVAGKELPEKSLTILAE